MSERRNGPKLPSELLARLNSGEVSSGPSKKRGLSRREARKQERNAKKHRKSTCSTKQLSPAFNFKPMLSHTTSVGSKKREPPILPDEGRARKKRCLSDVASKPTTLSTLAAAAIAIHSTSSTERQIHKPPMSGATVAKTKAKESLTIDDLIKPKNDRVEQKEIAWLEYQLGIHKKRVSSKSRYAGEFADDGLDDLLMDVDRILETTTTTIKGAKPEESSGHESDEVAEVDESSDQSEDEDEAQSELQISSDNVENEEPNYHLSLQELPALSGEAMAPPHLQSNVKDGRYVPPHLRQAENFALRAKTENVHLSRQTKGLLNRMSEQNIETIINDILALYRSNPRNDVTTAMASHIIEGISSHSSLLDAYVILHATLVASLHKLVGIDFAAHFVERSISTYERHLQSASSSPGQSNVEGHRKGCMNLIVLISELYNFQVISCVLVYDIIRNILDGALDELGIELLLRVMRNSGPQLRLDDPLALKDIVQLVQNKVADKNPRDLSSRLRFMIETLTNLKNNKLKQSGGHSPGADSVTRLRKFLNGLSKKHHVFSHEPINVSLADLRAADKRGKWWLVGSAWAGDPLAERERMRKQLNPAQRGKTPQHAQSVLPTEDSLFLLAKTQGMNTEVRKSIFVVLMSSDDYVDACGRLDQLNLNEIQRREIGRVIVHCCANEKVYNPFYTVVGQHLCRDGAGSLSFQITLQYCLWDFLRDIGEKEVGGAGMIANLDTSRSFDEANHITGSVLRVQNVANAYAWWVAKGSLSVSILKAIRFGTLREPGQSFFETFFAQLFISIHSASPLQSYSKLSSIPFSRDSGRVEAIFIKAIAQHNMLGADIYHFLSKARTRWGDSAKSEEVTEFLDWSCEVVKQTIRDCLDL